MKHVRFNPRLKVLITLGSLYCWSVLFPFGVYLAFATTSVFANSIEAPSTINVLLSSQRPALENASIDRSLMLDIHNHPDHRSKSQLLCVGEQGRIFYNIESNQNTVASVQATVPTQNLLTAVTFIGRYGWVVGHDAIILKSENFGESWNLQHLFPHPNYAESVSNGHIDSSDAGGMPLLDVWFANETKGFTVGAFGYILATHDGGKQWKDVSSHIENIEGFHLNFIGGVDDKRVWIAGEGGAIFYSQDGGDSWTTINVPFYNSWLGMELSRFPEYLYAYGVGGTLIVSRDQGDTWNKIELLDPKTQELILDGITDSELLNDNSIIFVGSNGLTLRLLQNKDMDKNEAQVVNVRYLSGRQNLSAVVQHKKKIWAVGMGGIFQLQNLH